MRILIADDDVISLHLLARTLERAGFEVTGVGDGRLAVDQLRSEEGPRIALLDWEMPLIDGPAVCREIRALPGERYVYIVLLTSRDSKEDTVAGLEAGADDYLIKPFHPEELKARLRAGLRILRLEDRLLKARDEWSYKATHDSLTSLLNRGVVLELLARELTRARCKGSYTTVVLGDLDHFKLVNDTYGHVVGDEVLREVGRRLFDSVRSYDYVGRYGGEEFLVVLPDCDAAAAVKRAEEIRTTISNSPVATTHGSVQVTMSMGVLVDSGSERMTVEALLGEVDSALYAAKTAGRNRVCLAAHPVG